MKKPYHYNDLSDRRCKRCGSRLKKNLLAKRPNAELDFKCWYPAEMARRGANHKGG